MVRALAGDSTMTRCLLPLLLGADLLVDLVATVAFWFVVASRRDNRLGRRCFSRAYVVYSTNVAHHPSQPHEHKRARDTWHLHARLLGPRRCGAQGAFGGEGVLRNWANLGVKLMLRNFLSHISSHSMAQLQAPGEGS